MKQHKLLALPEVPGSPGAPRAPRLSQGQEHPALLADVTIPERVTSGFYSTSKENNAQVTAAH